MRCLEGRVTGGGVKQTVLELEGGLGGKHVDQEGGPSNREGDVSLEEVVVQPLPVVHRGIEALDPSEMGHLQL